MKTRYLLTWLYRRPWLCLMFGAWIMVSMTYYWWLSSKINFLNVQNRVYRTQLRFSQNAMRQNSFDSPTLQEVSNFQVLNTPGSQCETIHLSFICMNKCMRQLAPMLKSILHQRQNPLHFHILVDNDSKIVISTLFDTWDLPDVQYTCYDSMHRVKEVTWVPTDHYSGVYALLKLLLPSILPDSLDRVIVLDSDLTFLCDIAELWALFLNMNDDQFIGLVENESNWYIDKSGLWPALGRGFNTGVMLLDLQKLRHSFDWDAEWHTAVTENIERVKTAPLADQDVVNAVINAHPHIVYNISCQYNLQMSMRTLARDCYKENIKNVKIVHWNSPQKYNISIKDAIFFRNIHQMYVKMDGNLLREKLHRCWKTEVAPKASGPCKSFRAAQHTKLRTHVYYMDYKYTSNDNFDVTLVLQLSMDRLLFLDRLARYWEGPLSAAIYIADCELNQLESFIGDWTNILSTRKNIGYHLVFKHNEVHYPVNYLRNVALEHVNTPYLLLMDVDFVPMKGLYEHLQAATHLINPYPQKKVLVVPAFETQGYRGLPPRSKPALLARLARRGDAAPFRAREWPRGHRATNYTRWAAATKPYEVEWENDYEPYLVVHRSVPRYDTRFSGFGWNKVSHIVELRARGYRAVVLPGAFVVHTTHAPSADITAFRADHLYRICLSLLKREFLTDLKAKYNVTFDEPTMPVQDTAFQQQAMNLALNQAKDTG